MGLFRGEVPLERAQFVALVECPWCRVVCLENHVLGVETRSESETQDKACQRGERSK